MTVIGKNGYHVSSLRVVRIGDHEVIHVAFRSHNTLACSCRRSLSVVLRCMYGVAARSSPVANVERLIARLLPVGGSRLYADNHGVLATIALFVIEFSSRVEYRHVVISVGNAAPSPVDVYIVFVVNAVNDEGVVSRGFVDGSCRTAHVACRIDDRSSCLHLILYHAHPFVRRDVVIGTAEHVDIIMQFAIYIHAVIVVVSVEGYEWKVSAGFVVTEFCLAGYGSLKYQLAHGILLCLCGVYAIVCAEHVVPVVGGGRVVDVVFGL